MGYGGADGLYPVGGVVLLVGFARVASGPMSLMEYGRSRNVVSGFVERGSRPNTSAQLQVERGMCRHPDRIFDYANIYNIITLPTCIQLLLR